MLTYINIKKYSIKLLVFMLIKYAERIKSFVLFMFLAPYFASDSTYVYSYEARVLGGLPEEGLARAGLKIRSKVFIRKAKDAFILKVNELKTKLKALI